MGNGPGQCVCLIDQVRPRETIKVPHVFKVWQTVAVPSPRNDQGEGQSGKHGDSEKPASQSFVDGSCPGNLHSPAATSQRHRNQDDQCCQVDQKESKRLVFGESRQAGPDSCDRQRAEHCPFTPGSVAQRVPQIQHRNPVEATNRGICLDTQHAVIIKCHHRDCGQQHGAQPSLRRTNCTPKYTSEGQYRPNEQQHGNQFGNAVINSTQQCIDILFRQWQQQWIIRMPLDPVSMQQLRATDRLVVKQHCRLGAIMSTFVP